MSQSNRQNLPWQEFITAVEIGNVEDFVQLVRRSSGSWRQIKIDGRTLLQEIIHQKEWEMFLFLLELCDDTYLEIGDDNGQTAITQAIREYVHNYANDFVSVLAKKYNTLPNHYHWILLQWCVQKGAFQTLEHLLKKGIDPNTKNNELCTTALQEASLKRYSDRESHGCLEYIMMLLFYGADPSLKFQTHCCFEISVFYGQCCEAQELLFDYTFDKLQKYRMNFKVLLRLAICESALFHRILEYDVEFVVEDIFMRLDAGNVEFLFNLEAEYLNIVLEKCYFAVCDSFNDSQSLDSFWPHAISHQQTRNFLEGLNRFLENEDKLTDIILDYIASISSNYFVYRVIKYDPSFATEAIIFMSLYGLEITSECFDWVYRKFGYGQLFRFLLHMDYVEEHDVKPILIVSLIRDIHKDLDSVCLQEPGSYPITRLLIVLDFFAHKKLTHFLEETIGGVFLKFSDKEMKRLRDHPQVPRLEELARNAFRKHLIQRHQVESTKHFYRLVQNLDISLTYRKIISLETRLYTRNTK